MPRCLDFIGRNDQFFLNVAMAMGKAHHRPARGIEGSSVVTAMCRNGTDFGIRVSRHGRRLVHGAGRDAGRALFPGLQRSRTPIPTWATSAIVETVGLGGFAMAAAPAVVGFVGAGPRVGGGALHPRDGGDHRRHATRSGPFPALDFAGVPTGIDIRLVVETGIAPTINTGIAHREPGVGQVGAGVVKAPLACFEQALDRVRRDHGRRA